MRTQLNVLSPEERARIHERTLDILAGTGVRVDTARGRQILRDVRAEVNEETRIVRFPRSLVEEALELAPRRFSLGARRPGWDLEMNGEDCALLVDGEALFTVDRQTNERRAGTVEDWRNATCLIDALDEVGAYWHMIEESDRPDTPGDFVAYLRELFGTFSKHVQDPIAEAAKAPWLLEVLQVIFGDREAIRRQHPLSFLLCPQSPLVIEGPYTDAYLALVGWDIPVAVMPMPLMGATSPASLISTVLLGNCEVLAMLCLIQAAAPGTPFIYAPALAVMNPRTGGYGGGPVEHALLGAAATEMARYYGLPAESSGLGSDAHVPGVQATYERAMNGLMPILSWPDLLVGPGLLGGSMVLSLEQMVVDAEIFRMARRARQGINIDEDRWLGDAIARVGPAGHFMAEESTVSAIREGEWYVSHLGVHDTFEAWDAAGRPTLLQEAREHVDHILST
ncbi:MAG: trimethylamine methyltransferase family protein, partial [Armatimonadota bacterium]